MKEIIVWQKGTKITYKRLANILSYEHADRIGKERGYGKTISIKSSLSFSGRIRTAARDFFAGIHYKYPVCCILNFCADTLLERPSVQLRWSDRMDHVECSLHVRMHSRKSILLDLY